VERSLRLSMREHWRAGYYTILYLLQMVEGFFTVSLFCPFLAISVLDHSFGQPALCSPVSALCGSLLVNALSFIALLLCATDCQAHSVGDLPHIALCLCAMGHQVDQDLSCLHCGPSRSHVSGPTMSSQIL